MSVCEFLSPARLAGSARPASRSSLPHATTCSGWSERRSYGRGEKGVSGYIGEGLNRWPVVHRVDAGKVVWLAMDGALPGAVLHAVSEEGIPPQDIAAAIGEFLGLPVATVPAERAAGHFGWLGMFFGADAPASSALTRERLGWAPNRPTLLADIAAGHYPGR